MIGYAFETLDEDVTECLAKWGQELPTAKDEVMIAFQIDKDGLQKAWVMDDAEIPFGPRTCFANAVYGIDWSHIVDHPAEVTWKFNLRPEDGGD